MPIDVENFKKKFNLLKENTAKLEAARIRAELDKRVEEASRIALQTRASHRGGREYEMNEIEKKLLELTANIIKQPQRGYDTYVSAMGELLYVYVVLSKYVYTNVNVWDLFDLLGDLYLSLPEAELFKSLKRSMYDKFTPEFLKSEEFKKDVLERVNLPLRVDADGVLQIEELRRYLEEMRVFSAGDPGYDDFMETLQADITEWLDDNAYKIDPDSGVLRILDRSDHPIFEQNFADLREDPIHGFNQFINHKYFPPTAPTPAP